MTDNDRRDPHLAARLHVEPLDEITRARLVHTAAEAVDAVAPRRSAGRGPAVWVAVAAAVLALLVVGGVVVTTGSDRGSSPTALRPETTESAERKAGGAAPDAAALPEGSSAPSATATAALPSLGDLGDVTGHAALRHAVAHATLGSPAPISSCAASAAAASGTPTALGAGSVNGTPVTVVVVELAHGRRAAVVVTDDPCRAGAPVPL